MKALINKLTSLIEINRLGHAYIIEGLNLEDRNDAVKIASALGITEQDVTVIMPEQSRSITVDQVRSTQDRLSRKPISGMHLVIFSPADLMNIAASNALLKLLEEQISETKEKIKKEKSTYSWSLYSCADDKCKDNVVRNFLQHLFNYKE